MSDDVPLDVARDSLLSNPLYPNMLISEDATTTAISQPDFSISRGLLRATGTP